MNENFTISLPFLYRISGAAPFRGTFWHFLARFGTFFRRFWARAGKMHSDEEG
jgi:hypothetical protein